MFRWKAQALVDAGVRDGIPSVEADELASARRRIAQLEAELALTRGCVCAVRRAGGDCPKSRAAVVEG